MSSETPAATRGLNRAFTYGTGESVSRSPTPRIPRLSSEFPSTLVTTTIAVKMRVLTSSVLMGEDMLKYAMGLVARAGRGRRLPLVADEPLTLGAQRHVFA